VVPGTFGTALYEVNGGSCDRVGTFLLCANFGELRQCEVRRTFLPGTSLNKGKGVGDAWGGRFRSATRYAACPLHDEEATPSCCIIPKAS
jgi:hypothetical protein